MKKVERSEILPLGAYEEIRERFRNRMIAEKRSRRIELGDHMSLMFENHDTVLLQIQEMLRTERISDERGIAHEIETYNDLIAPSGSVGATHFIEYTDKAQRAIMLRKFSTLREHVHLEVDGQRTTATFATHHGEEPDRIPAVNYLTFAVGDVAEQLRDASIPASFVVTHSDYEQTVELPASLRQALANDLTD